VMQRVAQVCQRQLILVRTVVWQLKETTRRAVPLQ